MPVQSYMVHPKSRSSVDEPCTRLRAGPGIGDGGFDSVGSPGSALRSRRWTSAARVFSSMRHAELSPPVRTDRANSIVLAEGIDLRHQQTLLGAQRGSSLLRAGSRACMLSHVVQSVQVQPKTLVRRLRCRTLGAVNTPALRLPCSPIHIVASAVAYS